MPCLDLALAALVLLGSSDSSATSESQEKPSARTSTSEPDAERTECEALVRQLGADAFAVREEAARKLSQRALTSYAAVAALKAGQHHYDVEVRLRSRRILGSVLTLSLENRRKAFLADADGRGEYNLPGWRRFRSLTGGDQASRELFLKMLDDSGGFLERADDDPRSMGELFSAACRELEDPGDPTVGPSRSLGRVATLLFVGSDERVPVAHHAAATLYQLALAPALDDSLRAGDGAEPMRRLLGAWIGRRVKGSGYQRMRLAMEFRLKEGLAPAIEMIESATTHAGQKAHAIMVVGKLGSREHVPLVARLLDDEKVCASARGGETLVATQIRDVALAVLVHLTGQSPKDYGFVRLEKSEQTMFSVHTLGFVEPAAREQALAKWRAWQNDHPAK